MKNGLLIIAVIATVGLVACKKNYTCTCTYTSGSSTATSTSTFKATKKDAKEACETLQTTGGASYSCVID